MLKELMKYLKVCSLKKKGKFDRAEVNAEIDLKVTAICKNMRFASLDKELRRFVKDNNFRVA